MKLSSMVALVCMASLAHAAPIQREYVSPEGEAPMAVKYFIVKTLHTLGTHRFALSNERAAGYEASLKSALATRRDGAEVLSNWNTYVLLVAEGAIEDGTHKIRIDGTSRATLESLVKGPIDAKLLETFNLGVSDGGCSFWEAILDANTSKLERFSCHGSA